MSTFETPLVNFLSSLFLCSHVGSPVQIQINMYIKSLGPISETEEDYVMDLYFRQMWTDSRLKFNASSGLTEFSLNWLFLEKVWKPDTYVSIT